MKKDIHPQAYTDCTVTCVCGNSFTTTSTVQTIQVDICSNCHPFYTGQQRFVDTEGRIEKFQKKQQLASDKRAKHQEKKDKKAKKSQETVTTEPISIKEMMKKLKEETKDLPEVSTENTNAETTTPDNQ